MFGQTPQRVAEGASNTGAGALGGSADRSTASPEPYSSRQLCDQVLSVVSRQLETTDIVHPRGLLDVIVDFGQTVTLSVAGLVVDHGGAPTDALERRIHALAAGATGWE
ncbi:hypothetical protein BH20ACT4_BH20ACT4_09580 [soil metagenome]